MTAYLDLIILENFCMNYLIIVTTGKLLCKKIKKARAVIASLIGVVFVFSLYLNVPKIILNILKILIAILLIKVSFNEKKMSTIFKQTLVLFFVSFIYSGCALGFVHFFKPRVIYIVNGIIIGGEYIFEIVLISSIISYELVAICMKLISLKKKVTKSDMLCDIEIFKDEKSVRLKALLDTGNLLTEPVSKAPVVVAQISSLKNLFNIEDFDKIISLIGGDSSIGDYSFYADIRAIPYVSVGNNEGIMFAYKVNKVRLEYHGEINEIDNLYVGLYNELFTKNNKYSALIGLQLLEGSEKKNESYPDTKNKGKYSLC